MPFPLVAIIIAVASLALNVISALLRPRTNDRPEDKWDIQTATEGRVIPVVWGTDLQESPNIVWWGDRREVRRNNIWRYFCGLCWVLAHGNTRLKAILVNDRVVWSGTLNDGDTLFLDRSTFFGQAGGGFVFDLKYYSGSGADDSPDPYLEGFIADYPHHNQFAYLVSRGPAAWTPSSNWKGFVGNSPQLPQIAFEVRRCPDATTPPPPGEGGGTFTTLTNETGPGTGDSSTDDFWQALSLSGVAGWDDENKWLGLLTPGYDPSGLSRFRTRPGSVHLGAHPNLEVIQFEIYTEVLPDPGCCLYSLAIAGDRTVEIFVAIPNSELTPGGWATVSVELTTAYPWRVGHAYFGALATQAQIDTIKSDIASVTIWVNGNRALNTVRVRNFSYNPTDGPPPPPAESGCIGGDANPIWMLYEAMTNPVWGAGVDPSDPYEGINVASFEEAAATVHGEGLGASHIQQEAIQMSRFAEMVMRHVDGVLYREPTTGQWTVRLIRDDYVVDDLPVVNEANVIEVQEYGADTAGVLRDVVRIKFKDRTKQYKESVATFRDPSIRALQGYTSAVELDFPMVRDPFVAQRIAEREALAYSYPLRRLRALCTRAVGALRPGDVFRFQWAAYGVNVVMRVTAIKLGAPADGQILVEAVEDKFSLASQPIGAPPDAGSDPGGGGDGGGGGGGGGGGSGGATIDLQAARADELPYIWGATPAPRISVMAVRSLPAQTGYSLDAAVAPNPPEFVQSARSLAMRTTTVTPLGGYEPDGHDYLVVQSTPEWAALTAKTEAQLRQGYHLAYLGLGASAELVAFASVTPVTGGLRLNGLRHGLADTTPKAWPAGTEIWLVEQATGDNFTVDFAASGTVTVRARSEAGSDVQSPPNGITATLTIASTHRRQRALPPRNLRVNGVYRGDVAAGYLLLHFVERNRFAESPSSLLFQDDPGASVAEPSGLLRIRLYDDTDTLIATLTGISGEEFWIDESYIFNAAGYLPEWLTVEIHGVIGTSFESWQGQRILIEYVT